ncbi:hypothetical protein HMN09_00671300 [Mycena chlorophos]|uniref:Uncharacterized protein n=1 Tax=Mycena chlorophos TaxID=658473 RepID=A0A8H6W734_MYCCL|nr:hypothetical protein HMN09_00671300 [Mycena chlorophos]
MPSTKNYLPSARPVPRRTRSSSLAAKANTVLPKTNDDAQPSRMRRKIAAPRKSSLRLRPTSFETWMPVTAWLDIKPVFDDSPSPMEAEPSTISSSEDHPEEETSTFLSPLRSFKASIDIKVTRTKLRMRRRSRPSHNHAHPTPNFPPRLVPQFSQPGCTIEAVSAGVDVHSGYHNVAGIVRFIVPDDTHLQESMNEEDEAEQ